MKINDGDLGYSLTKGSNAFVDIKQVSPIVHSKLD